MALGLLNAALAQGHCQSLAAPYTLAKAKPPPGRPLDVPASGSGCIREVKAKAVAEVVCILNWQRAFAFAHPLVKCKISGGRLAMDDGCWVGAEHPALGPIIDCLTDWAAASATAQNAQAMAGGVGPKAIPLPFFFFHLSLHYSSTCIHLHLPASICSPRRKSLYTDEIFNLARAWPEMFAY